MIRGVLIFFLSTIWVSVIAQSDSCYVRLGNYSGVNSDGDQSRLNEVACDLINTFPVPYQDSFRVFDYLFYSIPKDIREGKEKILETVIQRIKLQRPYYVLFGMINGRNDQPEIFVKLNLPRKSIFECYSETQRKILEIRIQTLANQRFKELQYAPFKFPEAEKEGIKKLKDFILEATNCCVPSGGMRSSEQVCGDCVGGMDYYRQYMEQNGFVAIPVWSLTSGAKLDTAGVFKEYADVSITTMTGEAIHVNEDVGDFLDLLSEKMSVVKGSVRYFDETNEDFCEGIMSIVEESTPELIAFNKKSGKSRNLDAGEYLLKFDIVATQAKDGSKYLHVKLGQNLPPLEECDRGTVYVVCLSDVTINSTKLRNEIDTFYQLISYVDNGNTYKVDPYVATVSFINQNNIKDLDAVSVVGKNKSKIVHEIDFYYRKLFADEDCSNLMSFLSTEKNVEKGLVAPPSIISMVQEADNILMKSLRSSTKEQATAFLVFHATGHNAGYTHFLGNNERCDLNGFMADGNGLQWLLGTESILYCNPSAYYKPYSSIRELVRKEQPYSVVSKMRKRFIKI